MLWVYEVIKPETGEIVKAYSTHCIDEFKKLCNKVGFIYDGWYGYFDENGQMIKA